MKKFIALTAFVACFGLVACSTSGLGGDGGACGGGCGGKMNTSQGTLDATTSASYWVQIHENPEAGQYWETTMEANGMVMTNRWQVASVDGNIAIVENEIKMDMAAMESDYVIAYQVDLSVEMGGVNVTKAWKGLPGEAGIEIDVNEKPACGGCAPACAPEPNTEDFADLDMAGTKFSGKINISEAGGVETRMWMADNGWFNNMIRMQSGDSVTALSAMGTDAEALLTWE